MLAIDVSAHEESMLPEEYYEMLEELPDELKESLPNGASSKNAEEISLAFEELMSVEYFLSFLGELFTGGVGNVLKTVALISSLLVLVALFNAFCRSFDSAALSGAVGFCSSCVVFASIIELQYGQIKMVSGFFERLNSLMGGMIPVTGAVYAMGGNISTAAASGGTMYAFLAVSELICAESIVPISSICTAFALCRAIAPDINVSGISSGIKKCYTFTLGLIMTLLLSLLGAQSYLSSAADGTASKAAKVVASAVIPIVGGSVGETLRSVASSVQYIKSIVGVGGIIFVLILLLPTLVSLLLNRLAFMICGCVADLLGCEREGRLLGELGGVFGCMIATVSMTSVMFILALNIFIRTAVAIM